MGEPSNALARRLDDLVRLDGAAASTAPLAFEGETWVWAGLPAQTQRLARREDPVLAERVVGDAQLYGSPAGLTQVLRAWRAHPGALVVAAVLRPVRIDGNVLRTAGPLTHASLRTFDAAATPRRRAGVVDASIVVDRGAVAGPGPSAPPHAAAHDAWRYLPGAVRQGAERVVPLPEDWLGDLRQVTDVGHPTSQDIVVLRRSASAAVVVVARRTAPEVVGATADEVARRLAHEPWSVEQITYDLREPEQLGATRPSEGLPWA